MQPEGGVIAIAPKPFARRPFPSNPWSGTDHTYIAQLREAFDRVPPVRLPDGPPLEQKEVNKLLWTLKGNIEEGYLASYGTTSVGVILVQAVRYTDAKWATPSEGRIVRGSTVILVTGNPQGECFKVVRDYIQSVK